MQLILSHFLDLQMKGWLSAVYKHFKMPPTINNKNGAIQYVFHCLWWVPFLFPLFFLCLTVIILSVVTLVSSSLVLTMMEASQTSNIMLSAVLLLTHQRLDRWHPMFGGLSIPLRSFVWKLLSGCLVIFGILPLLKTQNSLRFFVTLTAK